MEWGCGEHSHKTMTDLCTILVMVSQPIILILMGIQIYRLITVDNSLDSPYNEIMVWVGAMSFSLSLCHLLMLSDPPATRVDSGTPYAVSMLMTLWVYSAVVAAKSIGLTKFYSDSPKLRISISLLATILIVLFIFFLINKAR